MDHGRHHHLLAATRSPAANPAGALVDVGRPGAPSRHPLGTRTDLALADRRRRRALGDDSRCRRDPLDGLSALDRGPLESAAAARVQARASAYGVPAGHSHCRLVAARVRGMLVAARRSGGFNLGSDQNESEVGRVRVAAVVAGVEDGVRRFGLADESVYAAALDARLRDRALRVLRGRVGSLLRVRLVLT